MQAEEAANVDSDTGEDHEAGDPKVLNPGMPRRGQPGQLAGGPLKGDGANQEAAEGTDDHHGKGKPDCRVRTQNPVDTGVSMEPGEVEEVSHHIGGVGIKDQPDGQEHPEGEGPPIVKPFQVKA